MMKEGIRNYISFFKKILSIGKRSNEDYTGYLKVKYRKSYRKLENHIYNRCDTYQDEENKNKENKKFLSTFFYHSSDKFDKIPKRDLVFLASNVLNNLVEEKVLKVVPNHNGQENQKGNCRDTPYAFYKILLHRNLIEHNGFFEQRKERLN